MLNYSDNRRRNIIILSAVLMVLVAALLLNNLPKTGFAILSSPAAGIAPQNPELPKDANGKSEYTEPSILASGDSSYYTDKNKGEQNAQDSNSVANEIKKAGQGGGSSGGGGTGGGGPTARNVVVNEDSKKLPANNPPKIDSFSPSDNPQAEKGSAISFSVAARDPDGDATTVEWQVDGAKAESVAAKGERVTQKLITDLGQDAAEKVMGKLVNSEYGRLALELWNSEDAIKYYAKILEKYGIDIIDKRFSIQFKLGSNLIEQVMKDLDELSKVPNLSGFEKLERNIALSSISNGPGLFYEARVAVVLKNKGYELLEISKEIILGAEKGEIDNIFRIGNKKIASEIKTNVDAAKYAADSQYAMGLKQQLERYKKFIDAGNADEAWVIYRDSIPQAYKDYAESLGIKVFKESALP